MKKVNQKILICLALFVTGCGSAYQYLEPEPITPAPQQVEREFRAAWVATVLNINWPSKPGLSTAAQKQEARDILDLLAGNNFNAVILQVRPQCDAMYQSELEPWSYYLTGKQGQAPDPYYDPLSFWITEAHQRGLELHAWLNPFRAKPSEGGEINESSIIRTHPQLAVELADGTWWLDPGLPATQDHSLSVALDIVQRYDIDGLHMDDYFYPYPSYNDGKDFPDETSWQSYLSKGGKLTKADWRRENVNLFIKHLYRAVKDLKPHVKFGVSPFGIWRPYFPSSIRGFDQYNQLYADARLWLNEGWIDYWTPQLYWPVNQIRQSFPVLLGWWIDENKKNRHIWPGINIGRLRDTTGVDEAINQIMITRGMCRTDPGHVLWHAGILQSDTLLTRALRTGPYKNPALVPPSGWLADQRPRSPKVECITRGDTLSVSWQSEQSGLIANWVVYARYGQDWKYKILNRGAKSVGWPVKEVNPFFLPDSTQTEPASYALQELIVTCVSRTGLESTKQTVWKKED